jgi:hypothetical protein
MHNCGRYSSNNEKVNKKDRPSCINKHGKCKARFPRPLFESTQVDTKSGALNVKKGESWINTLTPLVTFLIRCNSDITSLLSGTAIKAIVAYISDYITKPGLKTYSIFDTIRSVFDRNSEMLGGTMKQKDKARKLIIQIINSLTAKLEIGGPMASLYLLGNPDHYTSHKFIPVYWKNYVREVLNTCTSDDQNATKIESEKVVLLNKKGKFISLSTVHDYIYRPVYYEDINLYEWVQCAKRVKIDIEQEHDEILSDDELDIIEVTDISSQQKSLKLQDSIVDNLHTDFDEMNIGDNNNIIEYDSDEYDLDDESDSTQSDETGNNLFLKDHPLYKTHCIEFNKKKNHIIPNFIGGSLPRRDRGDREYYCTTMLTLFKP